MKRLLTFILLAAVIAAVFPLQNIALAAETDLNAGMLDEIIIRFFDRSLFPGKEKQFDDEVAKILKDGLTVVTNNVYVVKAEDLSKNPNAILNKYKNSEFIEYVEPNYTGGFDAVPNDPNYTNLKALLTAVNAQAGWDIITGGGPVVAVIDSGVFQHPDLPKLLPGYSAVAGLSPNNDKLNHGTGVAGTIGALGNNGTGTVGINWNATLVPVKVDDANGTLTVANIAKGIIWAADNGARVLSLSVSTSADSVTLKNAIDYAYNKGCVIFASTGNDGKNAINYPSRYSNVMAVGATSNGTSRASISNYGAGMGVVAISSYTTTTATGGYVGMGGTSFSTPQVSGLASLMLALDPGLSNEEVYSYIQQGAKPLGGGYNNETGYGVVDIGKTLQLVRDSAAPQAVEPTSPEQEIDATPPPQAADTAPLPQPTDTTPPTQPVDTTPPLLPPPTDAPAPPIDTPPAMPPAPQQPIPTTPPVLTLKGSMEVQIFVGEDFTEPGFSAVDCFGADLTGAVRVSDNISISTPGIYTVDYMVEDAAGNTARATRTIIVAGREVEAPPASAPKLTIIGSDPIILHLDSGTPYIEQGANAYDEADGDISGKTEITGNVDRNRAGTYTIAYKVVNSAGLEASATRNVRILAPNESAEPRAKYNFSGQGKAVSTNTHKNVVADNAGWMDFSVTGIDKNLKIIVEVSDQYNGDVVFSDTYTGVGGTQFWVDEGTYSVNVTIAEGNGNSKYDVKLVTPEVIYVTFEDEEVPLGFPVDLYIIALGYNMDKMLAEDLPFTKEEMLGCLVENGFAFDEMIAFGFTPGELRDFGIAIGVEASAGELSGADVTLYTVVVGDSLWRIAQKQYGDGSRWREIYDLNKDIIGPNSSLIYPGQILTIKAA